ncbi:hypothetical protein ABHN03_04125 [Paenibacillus sp. NRS-1775]|uniref:hypothetical protein n=1 Tax=unclassified Paenibacillus TaxID=185978 RepID=UPI003D2AA1D1
MKKVKEASYLLFLLSNAAFGEKLSLQVNERDVDLSPISRSLCRIANEVFKVEIPFTANLGTYHFLRKQTPSSDLFKRFDPLIKSVYTRKESTRVVYLDICYDDKSEIYNILQKVAWYTGYGVSEIKINYREYLIKHLIQNELAAHEQLIFFNRVDYRDYLMTQFEI